MNRVSVYVILKKQTHVAPLACSHLSQFAIKNVFLYSLFQACLSTELHYGKCIFYVLLLKMCLIFIQTKIIQHTLQKQEYLHKVAHIRLASLNHFVLIVNDLLKYR